MALCDHAVDRSGHDGQTAALADVADLAWLLRCAGGREPERDAQHLLAEFGSTGAVLVAEPERLGRIVDKRCAAVLHAVYRTMLSALRPTTISGADDAIVSTKRLLDYLRSRAGHGRVEAAHVLYLDQAMRLLREEEVARGTRNHVMIDVREIIRRALDLGADAIIVAHNHPSGSLLPSEADIAATRKLAASAAVFGIRLLDHVIVTCDSAYSFAAEGRL